MYQLLIVLLQYSVEFGKQRYQLFFAVATKTKKAYSNNICLADYQSNLLPN